VLALILVGAVIFPGVTATVVAGPCHPSRCGTREVVRWSTSLASDGAWVAEDGVEGTVPTGAQAYAAIGHGVAAIGVGLTVSAYDALTGLHLWTTTLSGVPAGASIVSVRVWPEVVTVGVSGGNSGSVVGGVGGVAGGGVSGLRGVGGVRAAGGVHGAGGVHNPSSPGSGGQPPTGGGGRHEIVLNGATGSQLRIFPASAFGGAASASLRRTVVIGPAAVSSYSTTTGKRIWRDPTGKAEQAWRVDGSELYVSVSAQGEIGTAPVTAIRQISLRSGDQRLIEPSGDSFDGTLAAAFEGVLIFAGPSELSLYRATTGRLISQRPSAVFQGIDPVQHVVYVDVAGGLVGIDPLTGQSDPGTAVPGPTGTYAVRDGIALGLDPGAGGEAWGYSIAKRHVIWTTRSLPWPHYFVDLSGLGGSVDPATGAVLLATCAKAGQAVPASPVIAGSGLACLQPRLVAIGPMIRASARTQ
jgi:hypothetical protein